MRREAGTSGFPGDNPNWVKSILQASPELEGAASGGTVSQDYNYSRKTDQDMLHCKPKIIANDEKAAILASNLSNKKVSACTVWLRIPSTLLSKRFTHSPLPVSLYPCSLLCFSD